MRNLLTKKYENIFDTCIFDIFYLLQDEYINKMYYCSIPPKNADTCFLDVKWMMFPLLFPGFCNFLAYMTGGFLYKEIIWGTYVHEEYMLYELYGKVGYMNRVPSCDF